MKRYMMFFLTLLSTLIMSAQHIRVTAPKHVAVGEEFQIEYTIYTQDVRRFQLGKLSAGLEKVFGPATSSQSNLSMDMLVVRRQFHLLMFLLPQREVG